MENFVTDQLIFMTVAGSRMYGTSTPESDVDKRGVCVPPKKVVMGFARNFNQQEFEGEDTVVYALQKFMKLAADANPNIIELLFAPEDCIEVIHPTWQKLLERRYDFLSAKAYHTFSGYAHSQLKRIRGHREWLLNPPKRKPELQDFGLTESDFKAKRAASGVDVSEIAPEILRSVEKVKAFKAALSRWHKYESWKKNRNPDRAEMEARFGFDGKHALHLIRLLRMGKEILTTGNVIVRRPDAEELLAIRNGARTYEDLLAEAGSIDEELSEIYNSRRYVVPFSPDKVALSDLCVELHDYHWALESHR